MKKYFSAFILCILIFLLALSACDITDVPIQTGTDSIQDTLSDPSYDNISGDYIYRRANTSDGKILLLKYNVHTGEVDTVWCLKTHEAGLPDIQSSYRVTSIIRDDEQLDSIIVRVLSEKKPSAAAVNTAPTLEDYYLYVFGNL